MHVEAIEKEGRWRALLKSAERLPLQQSWAYGAAAAHGSVTPHRFACFDDNGKPIACAQVLRRSIAGSFGALTLMRGPVALRGDRSNFKAAAALLVEELAERFPRSAILWTPEVEADSRGLAASARRWRRVMTGYSTCWVDLRPSPERLRASLSGKWRNALSQGERNEIFIEESKSESGLRRLLDDNEAERKRKRYKAPPPSFHRKLCDAGKPREALVLLARQNTETVAGVLAVIHGRSATYQVGVTTASGRGLRAKHVLLWRAMLRLREHGVEWLDLGGVETLHAPGLARFKLGICGEVTTLPGTFLTITGRSRKRAPP